MVGMPSTRYYTISGEENGVCEFRVYYARPWEFSFDDVNNSKYVRKIVIPVTIIE